MSWLVSIVIGIGRRLAPALVCAYFTQTRGEQHRESDRRRWWTFAQRSRLSTSKVDDALAAYLQARMNYHDSPDVKAAKTLLEQAGVGQDGMPAGYVSPEFPTPR